MLFISKEHDQIKHYFASMYIKPVDILDIKLQGTVVHFETLDSHIDLPDEVKADFLKLYSQAVSHPKKTYKEIKALAKANPKSPEILNLFSYVCFQLKKTSKGNRALIQNYRENPENLFAKINFGDYLIRRGKKRALKKLFPSFDLTVLYPDRKSFHVSEYRGFMTMAGFYYLLIRDQKKAKCYHFLAKSTDPNHPSVVCLGKKLGVTPK